MTTNTQQQSRQQHRKPNRSRTTIEFWVEGDEWEATEPRSDSEIFGTGSDPREAVVDYIDQLEAREDE
jgi:hypothetical protein